MGLESRGLEDWVLQVMMMMMMMALGILICCFFLPPGPAIQKREKDKVIGREQILSGRELILIPVRVGVVVIAAGILIHGNPWDVLASLFLSLSFYWYSPCHLPVYCWVIMVVLRLCRNSAAARWQNPSVSTGNVSSVL